ncbi:MAG: glycosyltransferase family 39 protein, partial [Thermodesulfobacteriota bacterium]|nr:glycosyltransferase family 39 protein [Thermodesulfobacteriota bacterium]
MADDLIWGRRPGFWAGVLILGTTAARLAFIASGQLDLVQDEAQYWDWSRRLQASYFTKGPLIAWIIALWTKIFGVGAFGVRFGAVIGSAAIQLILYLGVGRLMQRPLLALLSLVVANTTLLFMVSGVLMTTDNPLLVFWFGALFCLYWGSLDRVSRWPFVLLIPCLALGTLAKYMMLAFVPTALLYAFLLGRAGLLPKRFGLRLAASLVLGVSLGLLPILLWNFANDFVGFRHIFHLAGVEGKAAGTLVRFDRFPDYMGSQVALVLPWWFVFMLLGAWRALKTAFARPQRAVGPDTGLDFRQACVFACGFWPMWGFFLLWSFHTKILANWSAVSYASGVVLAGAAFEAFVRKRSFKGLGIWLWPLLGCVIFGAVHVHDLLPVPYRFKVQVPFTDRVLELENPSLRLKGWTDLGAEIERFRQSAFKRPDRVF